MTTSFEERDPLGALVLIMACLAVAGTILAGAHYLILDQPVKGAPAAPENSYGVTGGIQIWSNPGNAYVDIQPVGGGMGYGGYTSSTGSYTLTDVPAYMSYRITVTKDSFLPYTTTLYVNPNIIAETNPTLQPDTPGPGTLELRITPYGGTVCVDGGQCETYDMDYNGELSRQVQNLDGNQYHTVTVNIPGYRPFSQDVWVPAGDSAMLRAAMERY